MAKQIVKVDNFTYNMKPNALKPNALKANARQNRPSI